MQLGSGILREDDFIRQYRIVTHQGAVTPLVETQGAQAALSPISAYRQQRNTQFTGRKRRQHLRDTKCWRICTVAGKAHLRTHLQCPGGKQLPEVTEMHPQPGVCFATAIHSRITRPTYVLPHIKETWQAPTPSLPQTGCHAIPLTLSH